MASLNAITLATKLCFTTNRSNQCLANDVPHQKKPSISVCSFQKPRPPEGWASGSRKIQLFWILRKNHFRDQQHVSNIAHSRLRIRNNRFRYLRTKKRGLIPRNVQKARMFHAWALWKLFVQMVDKRLWIRWKTITFPTGNPFFPFTSVWQSLTCVAKVWPASFRVLRHKS